MLTEIHITQLLADHLRSKSFVIKQQLTTRQKGVDLIAQCTNGGIHYMKEKFSINLSNSVSYYIYDDKADKATISTKVYDTERDTLITILCCNLIYPIIFYSNVLINKKENYAKDQRIPIDYFYNLESVKVAFNTHPKLRTWSFRFNS